MLKRISHKVIAIVAATCIAVIGGFSYFLVAAQQRALISQVEHNAHQISETIKSGTRWDMLLNQRDRLHRTIDTIGGQEGIEKIRVFNKEGRIIYSRDKEVIGRMVDKQAEACYRCHAVDQPLEKLSVPERTRIYEAGGDGRSLGIITPIYNERGCWAGDCHAHAPTQKVLGVLDVTMSLAEVDRGMAESRRSILLLAVTAILSVGLIIWLSLHRLVARPVGELVGATDAVASGDLEHRLPVRRDDELGRLARAFNGMTERLAEAQQQIYQSDKLASVGRLAAGVAHEINNPLTGVLTYSSFLLRRAPEGSPEREDLETIVRETKRCREIVKGLLDFSRQVPSQDRMVEVPRMIDHAIKIVRNQLSFGNVELVTDYADDLPPIRADENQLQQVIINLLVNAADAIGDAGGRISISVRHDAETSPPALSIEVADDGPGIAPEHLGRIFDPFFTTKEQRGTGLGLAVAWGIVDKHGGRLRVDSEEGRGATFTVRLPIRPTPGVAASRGAA